MKDYKDNKPMSEYIKYDQKADVNFNGMSCCAYCDSPFDYFVVKAGTIRLMCENCIAIDQQHETTQKILSAKTITCQIREREDRILLTGNSECGLCKADLADIENQVQLIKGYIKDGQALTIQTWANLCLSCVKSELSVVDKTTRRKMLVQMSTEIAMTLFLELTDDFCTSEEFFSTNWLEVFEQDICLRQLKLTRSFLPVELSGKAGRKAYRKREHREVYTLIKRELHQDMYNTSMKDGMIADRIRVLAGQGFDVIKSRQPLITSPEHTQYMNRKHFLKNRAKTRRIMGL